MDVEPCDAAAPRSSQRPRLEAARSSAVAWAMQRLHGQQSAAPQRFCIMVPGVKSEVSRAVEDWPSMDGFIHCEDRPGSARQCECPTVLPERPDSVHESAARQDAIPTDDADPARGTNATAITALTDYTAFSAPFKQAAAVMSGPLRPGRSEGASHDDLHERSEAASKRCWIRSRQWL